MEYVQSFTDSLGFTKKQPESISWCLQIVDISKNIISWITQNPWTCVFLVVMSILLFWFCGKYSVSVAKKKKPKINKSENFTRTVVEKLFNRRFPSVRPDWLNNPKTNNNLELDMYNQELKLAFEYQGKQHYEYNKFFHKSPADLDKQKEHDAFKMEVCKNNGVTLICVPYTVKQTNMKEFIMEECRKKNVKCPK